MQADPPNGKTSMRASDRFLRDAKDTFHASLRQVGRRLLPLRVSERRLLLAFIDLLILYAALVVLSTHSPAEFTLTPAGVWDRSYWFLTLTVIWFTFGTILAVYNLANAANALRSAWLAGGAATLTSGIYMLIPFLAPGLPDHRIYLLVFPLICVGGIVTWRILYATVLGQPVFRQRALIIGAGFAGRSLALALAEIARFKAPQPSGSIGYEPIGFIDDDPQKQGQQIAGIPVLGTSADLHSIVERRRPHELVMAITNGSQLRPELLQALIDCQEMGLPITTMTSLYEQLTGRVPVEHAGGKLDVVMPVSRPAAFRLYLFFHRLFDIVMALYGCLILGLLIPVVWLGNRLTDPGDLFYRQERVGERGRVFKVIKFRSMVMDAEKHTGAVWAAEGDPRITPMGHFLRKTRLDEVPQFWNVLRGEMSFIGPRPERPFFVSQLVEEIPFYRLRHAVKPGITGWAQVQYAYGASVEDALIKLQYDLYYIKRQGPYLDLQILLRTVQVTLGMRGR